MHNCSQLCTHISLGSSCSILKTNYQGSSPLHLAVASGLCDITKYLLEMRVNADHKTKMGKGILQLAKNAGGLYANFYKHLQEEVKDKHGHALIETFIKSTRPQEDKCQGSHQKVYRELTRITSKGHLPTETRKGKGEGDSMCYKCGQPGHISYGCPNPASSGKGRVKGKGKEPGPSYQYRCLTCQAPDHRYCDCPSLSFKGKSGSSGK